MTDYELCLFVVFMHVLLRYILSPQLQVRMYCVCGLLRSGFHDQPTVLLNQSLFNNTLRSTFCSTRCSIYSTGGTGDGLSPRLDLESVNSGTQATRQDLGAPASCLDDGCPRGVDRPADDVDGAVPSGRLGGFQPRVPDAIDLDNRLPDGLKAVAGLDKTLDSSLGGNQELLSTLSSHRFSCVLVDVDIHVVTILVLPRDGHRHTIADRGIVT